MYGSLGSVRTFRLVEWEPVPVTVPDPLLIRQANREELQRLGLPGPPGNFPFVWEIGDEVALRPRAEIEARAVILNVVLARCFGMPPKAAIAWLLDAHLIDQLTEPEF